MKTIELIRDGELQAVKLPRDYQFEGTQVSIRREGNAVILEPLKPRAWPAGLFDRILVTDPNFGRPEQSAIPPAPVFDRT